MLSVARFTLFTICISKYAALEQYDKGWRPTPSEEVYRTFRLNTRTPSTDRHTDDIWNQLVEVTADDTLLKHNAIKEVNPLKIFSEFNVKRIEITPMNVENQKPMRDTAETANPCDNTGTYNCPIIKNDEEDASDYNFTEIAPTQAHDEGSRRRAKKIDKDITSRNLVDDQESLQTEQEELFKGEDVQDDESNSYEVTENTEGADVISNSAINIKKYSGYSYKRPNVNINQAPNLTKSFLNILAKYNIRNSDDTSNYARSRVYPGRKPVTPQLVFLPVPVKYARGYSSWGPPRAEAPWTLGRPPPAPRAPRCDYHDLYGYLASNYIHNNLPLGNYKLFSDTDSSNK